MSKCIHLPHGKAKQASSGTQGKSLMPSDYKGGIPRYLPSCEASGPVRPGLLPGKAPERTTAMTKQQKGYLFHRGQSWFLRYYDTDASGQRDQKCEKLKVPYSGEYRTKKKVQAFVNEILDPLNGGMLVPESTTPVAKFIEDMYLACHVKTLRPASQKQYRDIWANHLKAAVPADLELRKFRTVNGQAIMDRLAAKKTLGLSSLRPCEGFSLRGV